MRNYKPPNNKFVQSLEATDGAPLGQKAGQSRVQKPDNYSQDSVRGHHSIWQTTATMKKN
jgi:hypothetical protein